MNIGERLKYARRCRKMTQNDLAEYIGVSRGVITNIEFNKVESPQPIVTTALCSALRIESDWLLFGKGEMEILETRIGEEADMSEELYGAIDNLSTEEQALLLKIIKLIRQKQ